MRAKSYRKKLIEIGQKYKNSASFSYIFDEKNLLDRFFVIPGRKNYSKDLLERDINLALFGFKDRRHLISKSKLYKTYLDNIKYFNTPEYVKDASLDNIYKTDKNRFTVINWLMDFLDDFESGKACKGLYLHGNFGCGKTYLIAGNALEPYTTIMEKSHYDSLTT